MPRKRPVYPPVPPLPTDPDFGLIDRFYRARVKGDLEELGICIGIAKELVMGPYAGHGRHGVGWDRAAVLLGIPGQERDTLARIRHLLGIS